MLHAVCCVHMALFFFEAQQFTLQHVDQSFESAQQAALGAGLLLCCLLDDRMLGTFVYSNTSAVCAVSLYQL